MTQFDKLAYLDKLKSAGIDDAAAHAHADALDTALRDTVATKFDLGMLRADIGLDIAGLRTDMAGLRTELKTDIAGVRTEIANAESRLLRWFVATQMAGVGALIAAGSLIAAWMHR